MRIFPAVAAVLSLAALLSSALAQESVDRRAEEQRIRDLDRQWIAAGAAHELEGHHEPVRAGRQAPAAQRPPVEGREAIGRWWHAFMGLPELSLTFQPTKIEVAGAGDLAYDTGSYLLSFKSDVGPFKEAGKYLQVWTRVDGQWRLAADMFSGNGAPPAK